MKKHKILIATALLSLIFLTPADSQYENNNHGIQFLAVSQPSEKEGHSYLNLYIKMPYSTLQFIRESNAFEAAYDFSVEVTTEQTDKIERKFWREEISTIDFNETTSPKRHLNSRAQLELLPGNYTILLEINSLNSSQNFSLKKTVVVKSFWEKGLCISDPVFTSAASEENDGTVILSDSENITAEYSNGIELYFQIFNKSKEDFNLKWRVSSYYSDELEIFSDDILVSSDEQIIEKNLILNKELLYSGPYLVVINVERNGISDEVKKRFNLMWLNKPINLDNIEELLDQMSYIIPKDTFQVIRQSSTAEKKEYFEKFWNSRDPEPETPQNELMREYFRRIDYANQVFSYRKKIGSKTDRGRTYIVYGEPDRRIKLYNEPGKPPFEIWVYSRINKKYLFVDRYRIGEFPLTPFTNEYDLDYYYY